MKKQVPDWFYKPESVDQLKQTLNLVPDMVEHPEFPFGDELSFIQLAVLARHIYERTYPE